MFYQRTLIVYSQAVCRIQKIKKNVWKIFKSLEIE